MIGIAVALAGVIASLALMRYRIRHRRKFYDCSGLVGHVELGRPRYDDYLPGDGGLDELEAFERSRYGG